MGLNAIRFYMMEEGMKFLGSVKIQGNVPCIKCGKGDECEMSGVKMLYGSTANVDSIGIATFEHQSDAVKAAEELGQKIRHELTK
jgi:hypothetical protein